MQSRHSEQNPKTNKLTAQLPCFSGESVWRHGRPAGRGTAHEPRGVKTVRPPETPAALASLHPAAPGWLPARARCRFRARLSHGPTSQLPSGFTGQLGLTLQVSPRCTVPGSFRPARPAPSLARDCLRCPRHSPAALSRLSRHQSLGCRDQPICRGLPSRPVLATLPQGAAADRVTESSNRSQRLTQAKQTASASEQSRRKAGARGLTSLFVPRLKPSPMLHLATRLPGFEHTGCVAGPERRRGLPRGSG